MKSTLKKKSTICFLASLLMINIEDFNLIFTFEHLTQQQKVIMKKIPI